MKPEEKLQAEAIMAALRKMFGEGVEFRCDTLSRTNLERTGISLLLPEQSVMPVVYLDELPEGASVPEKADYAAARFQEILQRRGAGDLRRMKQVSQSLERQMNREYILEHVVLQLLSRERNQSIAESRPHIDLLDLIGVFRIPVGKFSEGNLVSFLLGDDMVEAFGLGLEELTEAARKNTVRLFGVEFFNTIDAMMAQLAGSPWEKPSFEEVVWGDIGMYTLTNNIRVNGAALILIPEIMRAIGRKAKMDLYVIPSSIHEVLIVREDCPSTLQELKQQVHDVNRSVAMTPDIILSDQVYRCDWETGELSFA